MKGYLRDKLFSQQLCEQNGQQQQPFANKADSNKEHKTLNGPRSERIPQKGAFS